MASRTQRTILNLIPTLFSDRGGNLVMRLWLGKLINELGGRVTDKFLEILLYAMDLGFSLLKGFRRNIENFQGRYVFRTADNLVATSATFGEGDMQVHSYPIEDWDVRITFKDAPALRRFLFAGNQDILNSILANEVEVDGNLNYLYKFGFLARDLGRRLGVM